VQDSRPVTDGHYYVLAYTGAVHAPRFLYHDQDRGQLVTCGEEPKKTEWAIIFAERQPAGYEVWRHPLLGRLLDHNRENDTAIVYEAKDPSLRGNQTWAIRKHNAPTPE
jgi:hypothetical protein